MTPDDFRALALAVPGAIESAHMNHPDFRVDGRIFATLGHPGEEWGMVGLTPEQQHELVMRVDGAFTPAKGAWGRSGSTLVQLEKADSSSVQHALRLAAAYARLKNVRKRAPVKKGATYKL